MQGISTLIVSIIMYIIYIGILGVFDERTWRVQKPRFDKAYLTGTRSSPRYWLLPSVTIRDLALLKRYAKRQFSIVSDGSKTRERFDIITTD